MSCRRAFFLVLLLFFLSSASTPADLCLFFEEETFHYQALNKVADVGRGNFS